MADVGPLIVCEGGIEAELTCEAAPVQIEGMADGHPFYFRSRWWDWTFTLVAPDDDPVSPHGPADSVFIRCAHYGSDIYFDASWMPHAEAWRIVRACVDAWRAGEPNVVQLPPQPAVEDVRLVRFTAEQLARIRQLNEAGQQSEARRLIIDTLNDEGEE